MGLFILHYFLFYVNVGSVHWGDSQPVKSGIQPADFLIGADGYASLGSQSEAQPDFPIMDHWNVSRTRVSLRDIMTEEHARQKTLEKVLNIHTVRSINVHFKNWSFNHTHSKRHCCKKALL